MTIDGVWLWVLIGAVVFNLVLRFREDRRRAEADLRMSRAQRTLAQEYAIILGNVLSMSRVLQCWAETWGEPPEVVRPKLIAALRTPEGPQPAVEEDTESG